MKLTTEEVAEGSLVRLKGGWGRGIEASLIAICNWYLNSAAASWKLMLC